MTRTKVLITMGIVSLVIAVLLSFTLLLGRPTTVANAALGFTLTPTSPPTATLVPPTATLVPPTATLVPPTATPPPPPTKKPSSKPAATPIPTPTPIPILPISGGDRPQTWIFWALGVTALLCGLMLRERDRSRRAREA
ncbi:MAG: hypothetical protein V3S14_00600 [Anaerolineae bacterium]